MKEITFSYFLNLIEVNLCRYNLQNFVWTLTKKTHSWFLNSINFLLSVWRHKIKKNRVCVCVWSHKTVSLLVLPCTVLVCRCRHRASRPADFWGVPSLLPISLKEQWDYRCQVPRPASHVFKGIILRASCLCGKGLLDPRSPFHSPPFFFFSLK